MTLQKYLSINDVSLNQNKKDLTNDLPSLNFETALSKEELSYLSLRARHHCFTVATCAYAVYLVSTFNELRCVLSEMRNPINKKTIKFLKQSVPRNPIKVGVIGCGRLGKQIITSLISYCDLKNDEILVSTRRPNLLTSFQNAGIKCIFNNEEIVSSCDLVFLCCLPSQIDMVAGSVVGCINKNTLICSFVTGVGLPRLKQIFRHNSITKMDFTWSIDSCNKSWCLGDDVVNSLKKEWVAESVYPLSEKHKTNSIVWCSPKAVETAIYGSLNMCPSLDVTTEEAMHLVNIVFLGTADTNKKLNWSDVLDKDSLSYVESGNLPVFDLFHIGTQNTPLADCFKKEDVKELLVQKYKNIFNQFKNA